MTDWKHPDSVLRIRLMKPQGENGPHCQNCAFKQSMPRRCLIHGVPKITTPRLPYALGAYCCTDWLWTRDQDR